MNLAKAIELFSELTADASFRAGILSNSSVEVVPLSDGSALVSKFHSAVSSLACLTCVIDPECVDQSLQGHYASCQSISKRWDSIVHDYEWTGRITSSGSDFPIQTRNDDGILPSSYAAEIFLEEPIQLPEKDTGHYSMTVFRNRIAVHRSWGKNQPQEMVYQCNAAVYGDFHNALPDELWYMLDYIPHALIFSAYTIGATKIRIGRYSVSGYAWCRAEADDSVFYMPTYISNETRTRGQR